MTTWIVAKPGVLGGKPCIRGTRVSVDFILDLVASGASVDSIVGAYPHLPAEGVHAALEYAAQALRSEHVWELDLSA